MRAPTHVHPDARMSRLGRHADANGPYAATAVERHRVQTPFGSEALPVQPPRPERVPPNCGWNATDGATSGAAGDATGGVMSDDGHDPSELGNGACGATTVLRVGIVRRVSATALLCSTKAIVAPHMYRPMSNVTASSSVRPAMPMLSVDGARCLAAASASA